MEIKVKAYAKINLMLDIIYKRTDGYHDLFMIMQSIGIYDTVTVRETKSKKITITCNIDDIPLDEHNIAYKAAAEFFSSTKIKNKGINIDIVKSLIDNCPTSLFPIIRKDNKIKKQEEINGDSLQEEWDQDVTDLGKGYYLTKDWIVSTHSPAMAFHKNTIDDYTVEKDFVRGKEVHIYTLRGNGASIQMRFTENGSGENLSSVNKWFKRRREELIIGR